MDMTHMLDSLPLPVELTNDNVTGIWLIKEIDPKTKRVVSTIKKKNIMTSYGLSALASALNGGYTPPIYLVIENTTTTLYTQANIGDSQVQLNARVDITGDNQLVLDPGLGSQETVTYTSVTGSSAPYTYALSGTVANTHANGNTVCRNVNINDTMSSVQSEVQYDPVNYPNQRSASASGYSTGAGVWTVQFYMSGQIAQQYFTICGLADSITLGQGNLHNHFVLGLNRNGSTNDIEIDAIITISNA
jgi:hypothetical protein